MSIEGHAAAIRADMERMGRDPVISRRYATVAARWDQLRISRHRGLSTPGDDARVTELTRVLGGLCEQLGLETATDPGVEGVVVGVTVPWGPYLPGDCGYLINGWTWDHSSEL